MKARKMSLAILMMMTTLLPMAAQAVEKSNRDLLVVASLVTNGDPRYAWLYQFLNASAITLAQMALGMQYRQISVLSGPNATRANFTGKIQSLSSLSSVQALDVMLHLHGSRGTLWFADGSRSSSAVRTALGNGTNPKLRLLYSTACYGGSHAADFIGAGFKVVNGARAVNANASYEYPVILGQWATGHTFSEAQTLGNDPTMRAIHDAAARAVGFTDVDSFKIVRGYGSTRISSSAQ
jgi:hypothetical protein